MSAKDDLGWVSREDSLTAGYVGYQVDPTPAEGYALPGNGPNPETDAQARKTAKERREALRLHFGGFEPPVEPASGRSSSRSSTASSASS